MGLEVQAAVHARWNSEIRGAERAVLNTLAYHANDKTGWCWPGVELLAQEAGITARAVQLMLSRLVERGALNVELGSGPRGVHRYQVLANLTGVNSVHPRRIDDGSGGEPGSAGGERHSEGGEPGAQGVNLVRTGGELSSPKPEPGPAIELEKEPERTGARARAPGPQNGPPERSSSDEEPRDVPLPGMITAVPGRPRLPADPIAEGRRLWHEARQALFRSLPDLEPVLRNTGTAHFDAVDGVLVLDGQLEHDQVAPGTPVHAAIASAAGREISVEILSAVNQRQRRASG